MFQASNFEIISGETCSVNFGLEVEEAAENFVGVVVDDVVERLIVVVDSGDVVIVDASNSFVFWFTVFFVDDSAGFIEYVTIEFKKGTAVLEDEGNAESGVPALKLLGRVTLGWVDGGLISVPVGIVGVTGHEDLL